MYTPSKEEREVINRWNMADKIANRRVPYFF